jgi:hypothetical protein
MSETPRQLPALLTALADNTTAQITPEDIRDMLVSLYPSRGQLELAPGGSAPTTFVSSGTYVKIAGTTAIDAAVCSTCVSQPADGVLKWEKAQDQVLLANATLEVLPAANNKRYTFTFAKNGVAIPTLAFVAYYGNLSGNPAGVFLSGLIPIAENDEISVVVKNDTDTTAITAAVLTMSGVGVMV